MMKIDFVIVFMLLMVRLVSSEDLSPVPIPAPASDQAESPDDQSFPPQPGTEMSPSPTRLDSKTPAMVEDSSNVSKGGGGGGSKAGIAVGVIAAASAVGFAGYVMKKRRENIRRSRYDYAATEIL